VEIQGNIGYQNEKIRLKIEVTPIDEQIRKSRLRWFGHVQRKEINVPVGNCELIQVEGTKKDGGRPKITLREVVTKGHVN
jgi:hypothetical protein